MPASRKRTPCNAPSREPRSKRARVNLNNVRPSSSTDDERWRAATSVVNCARVDIIFDGIRDRLVSEIRRAHFVLGCVAWLSDWGVLEALQSRPGGVSLIVHEESNYGRGKGRFDSVRAHRAWTSRLKRAYEALPALPPDDEPNALRNHPAWANAVGFVRANQRKGVPARLDALRCVGPSQLSAGKTHSVRMHHKFLLFGNVDGHVYAAWTGSFNPTPNASMSTENAIVLHDPRAASAFLDEFVQLALASRLNPPWCRPGGARHQRYEPSPLLLLSPNEVECARGSK